MLGDVWRSSLQITPLGYIAKRIIQRFDWLDVPNVESIYSVANCMSEDFTDYIDFWRHNGFWLFDHPDIITEICVENSIESAGLRFLYLESELIQYDPDQKKWIGYLPEPSFPTNVVQMPGTRLLGYDVATVFCGNVPDHSPLSCNHVASVVPVNRFCLIDKLDDARDHIENGVFANSEPGYLRIIAVHDIEIGTNRNQ